jgi:hypothetical protein
VVEVWYCSVLLCPLCYRHFKSSTYPLSEAFPNFVEYWVCIFLFWRLAYNLGLGYILHKQSHTRFMSYYFTQVPGHPMNERMKSFLNSLMEKDYNYDVRVFEVIRSCPQFLSVSSHVPAVNLIQAI